MKQQRAEVEFFDKEKETMPRAQRAQYLDEKLRHIVQYAYRNAPAVKEIFDNAGITPEQIQTVKDLDRVPVTTKDDLVRLQRLYPPSGGFLVAPVYESRKVYMSPGPIYHFEIDVRGVAKAQYTAGFRRGDLVLDTLTYHLFPGGHGADDGTALTGASSIPAGPGNSEVLVRVMRDLKVTAYLGTPTFLLKLIETAERLGYNFRKDFELRRASVSGEPLPESLRSNLQEQYGVNVTACYQVAELAMIGYECSQKSGFHVNDDLIVEIADPETGRQLGIGESGEVVGTNSSERNPFIRFGTGDLSYLTDEPCSCGRTSLRLAKILGKARETAARVKGGALFYTHQLEEAVSCFPELLKFQAVIDRIENRDQVTVRVELKDMGVDTSPLEKAFKEKVREICQVTPDRVEFLCEGTFPERHKKLVDQRTWE